MAGTATSEEWGLAFCQCRNVKRAIPDPDELARIAGFQSLGGQVQVELVVGDAVAHGVGGAVRCSALHRQPGHLSDAKCAASDSISALLSLAKSGSGFSAVPCDRVPPRICCNDQTV